jgi:hypothetical protein
MARVLVADDSCDVRASIEAVIGRDGHDVVTAGIHEVRHKPLTFSSSRDGAGTRRSVSGLES